jgi:hypothetical protein
MHSRLLTSSDGLSIMHGTQDLHRYTVNVIFVVATIANGDGASEASRLLGMLGLPRPQTMGATNFSLIEDRIAPVIWLLHEKIMLENLDKEIQLSCTLNAHFLWKQSLDDGDGVELERANYPMIRGSYDTGWNQRASGKVYNSSSSHSFLVGAKTRLPVEGEVLSKRCSICFTWEKNKQSGKIADAEAQPPHYCVKNFDATASSGSMEPFAAARIVNRLHNKWKTNVEMICMDDDASTRMALNGAMQPTCRTIRRSSYHKSR